MPLTFDELSDVNLERLGTAVSDWKKASDHLKTLARDAKTGMQAKSDSARWAGANASVTQDFVRKTAKEVGDLHTEASSIYEVLDDAHRELVELQRSVKHLVSEAQEKGFVVRDNGDTTVSVTEYVGPGEPAKSDHPDTKTQQHYADLISSKVGRADEIDRSVKFALARIHGNDVNNAGHSSYSSLDQAQAQRAVALAKKGAHMTDRELAELNQILRFNGREKNGEFATDFYEGLGGPEKALTFYGQMSLDGTSDEASRTRLDAVKEFQRNIGYSLATATDPDSRNHLPNSWAEGFRRLGTKQIEMKSGSGGGACGYQILGGIIRFGDYDPRFLNPIAEHIAQLHQKDPSGLLTFGSGSEGERYGFNPSGKVGSGQDPLSSVLEALGHSPEAATDFFTNRPTAYAEDGSTRSAEELGFSSYLDLFTDEGFQWNVDSGHRVFPGEAGYENAINSGRTALGHALEAAATGLPYDSNAPSIPHSEDGASLVSKLVEKFGENPDLLDGSPLNKSLGNITGEYMRDVLDGLNGKREIETFGSNAHLGAGADSAALQRYLAALGKDPEAYGVVLTAQQSVTTELIGDALKNPAASGVLQQSEVDNMVAPGAEVAGIMAESRTQAVYDEKIAKDAEFNSGLGMADKWVQRGIDMGVSKIPVGGEAANWAVGHIHDAIFESYLKDSSDMAELDRKRFLEEQKSNSGGAVYDATRAAAIESGLSPEKADILANHAEGEVRERYGLGRLDERN